MALYFMLINVIKVQPKIFPLCGSHFSFCGKSGKILQQKNFFENDQTKNFFSQYSKKKSKNFREKNFFTLK
jgi:hypothetical protein